MTTVHQALKNIGKEHSIAYNAKTKCGDVMYNFYNGECDVLDTLMVESGLSRFSPSVLAERYLNSANELTDKLEKEDSIYGRLELMGTIAAQYYVAMELHNVTESKTVRKTNVSSRTTVRKTTSRKTVHKPTTRRTIRR